MSRLLILYCVLGLAVSGVLLRRSAPVPRQATTQSAGPVANGVLKVATARDVPAWTQVGSEEASEGAVRDPRLEPAWDAGPEGQVESRDWCGQAHRLQRERQEGKEPPVPLHDPDHGDSVLGDAIRRVLERWARALEKSDQPDDRIAAGLLRLMRRERDRSPLVPPSPEEARDWRRLIDLADKRRDAVAWVLPHCPAEQCVDAARWLVKVDGGNVHAWLAADRQLAAETLLEGMAQAREVRPYEPALLARWVGLATQAPGLRDAAELEVFETIGSWHARGAVGLLAHSCSMAGPSDSLAAHCIKAAEHLRTLGDRSTFLRSLAQELAGPAKHQAGVDAPRAVADATLDAWSRLDHAVRSCDASARAGAILRERLVAGQGRFH